MTKLTIWAKDADYGLSWGATKTEENIDLSRHDYIEIEELDLAISDEEIYKLLEADKETRKEVKRAKLIAQLEALDNE